MYKEARVRWAIIVVVVRENVSVLEVELVYVKIVSYQKNYKGKEFKWNPKRSCLKSKKIKL
jgi:hypothetical protein